LPLPLRVPENRARDHHRPGHPAADPDLASRLPVHRPDPRSADRAPPRLAALVRAGPELVDRDRVLPLHRLDPGTDLLRPGRPELLHPLAVLRHREPLRGVAPRSPSPWNG